MVNLVICEKSRTKECPACKKGKSCAHATPHESIIIDMNKINGTCEFSFVCDVSVDGEEFYSKCVPFEEE